MNEDIKFLWIEALTSGKYSQGRGCLRDPYEKFCCLGLLCDLHAKSNPGNVWENGRYLQSSQFLPPEVSEWANLTSVTGRYGDKAATLADDNDNGRSFREIAEIIFDNF